MKKIKIVMSILMSIVIIFSATTAIYVGDYYHAQNVSEYLKSNSEIIITKIDEGYFFDSKGTDKAFIFYPGAKVEFTAYAPLMREISEKNNIDCFLVKMPGNFAFMGINKAEKIMSEYQYDKWYLSGHSLGGAMVSQYCSKNIDKVDGLILLAAYSTSDLTKADFPIISIYGSNDDVLNRKLFNKYKSNMPSTYTEYVIEGGNHSQYASYGLQKGDNKAEISAKEQLKRVSTIIEKNI